ncbi:MAG: hypothetical protein KA188_07175, partial [Leadbetterella sp.]|nr:hypothetical protein [Leadbetterella sp.]
MKVDNPYRTPIKGMTIFKAFLLVFLCVIFIHVIGFFFKVGFLYSLFESYFHNSVVVKNQLNTYSYIISYFVFTLIGFRINNYEIPFFSKLSFFSYFIVIILGALWFIIDLFLIDLFLMKYLGKVTFKMVERNYFDLKGIMRYLASFLSVAFTIGAIGHGLLRNYTFRSVTLVLVSFSLFFLNPILVFELLLQNLILIYIYYQFQAFQLCLLFVFTRLVMEVLIVLRYSYHSMLYGNVIKNEIIGNGTIYYLLIAIVFCLFLYILYSFRNLKRTHTWLR